jgi:hypothetical protein
MDSLFSTIMGNKGTTDKAATTAAAEANKNKILQNQQMTQQKLTDLLNKSMDSLSCGPSCQKERTADDLKQKYMKAQINVETAPIQLEDSKKNYYTFTEGEPAYENMKEEELKTKAKAICQSIGDSFNKEVDDAYAMSSSLSTTSTSNDYIQELLEKLKENKKKLLEQYNNTHGDMMTNDRKVDYETNALNTLEFNYNSWWKIYYFMVLIYIIVILLQPSSTSIIVKIIYILLWVNYPYIFNWLFGMINHIKGNIATQVPKNVYESP